MAKNNNLQIGTFNCLNLIMPGNKYYGNKSYTEQEFSLKKNWMQEQLRRMNCDIVGFQEVFSKKALHEIMEGVPKLRNATILIADMDNNPENSDSPSVALATRFPVSDYEVITTFPEQLVVDGMVVPFKKFSRPVLKARVRLSDSSYVIVFVAHLKSKNPMLAEDADRDDPVEQAKGAARSLLVRAAEANALRTILMETLQHRDHPVVVMGDLNDSDGAVTTQIISGSAPHRRLPMEKKLKIWDVMLYHAKDIQARLSYNDVYYTHIHNGHYESLDHILVSQELVRENPKHIGRVASVRVFNDHLFDETLSDDRIPCWNSDHGQVVVNIEMNTELY